MKLPFSVPPLSQWYSTYSRGSLQSILTIVSTTSQPDSAVELVQSSFGDLLNYLSITNCTNLQALCDFSLSRGASIFAVLPLLQNSLPYRSWWLSGSSKEPGKREIGEAQVEAMHMQVLLGLALIGWEQWDVSLLQTVLQQMRNRTIEVPEMNSRKQTWFPDFENDTPSKVEMATLIAVNILRMNVIQTLTSVMRAFVSEWGTRKPWAESSLLGIWNQQVSYLVQFEKNLRELLVSYGPGVLQEDIESIPIFFQRFTQPGLKSFSNPSLQRLWEEEDGKQAVSQFLEAIMPKSTTQEVNGIQRCQRSIFWKWKNWNSTIQIRKDHTLKVSVNGDISDYCLFCCKW